jgi:hypothetical protein
MKLLDALIEHDARNKSCGSFEKVYIRHEEWPPEIALVMSGAWFKVVDRTSLTPHNEQGKYPNIVINPNDFSLHVWEVTVASR